jgi:hypothetical protein
MREGRPDVISDLWYKSAVIYNCDVRTFQDANGDGVGDFRGLQRRLDYLSGLGITALWLMPFYASPYRPRRRLRHHRLLRRRPALRDARRLRRVHARRPPARHPPHHRSGGEPHLRRAPVVQGGALFEALEVSRVVRLVGEAPSRLEQGDGLPRRPEVDLDARRAVRRVVLPSLLRLPARSRHLQPGGAGRDPAHHGLLAAARRLRLSHGRRAVRHRKEGRGRRAARAVRHAARPALLPELAERRRHPPGRGERAAADRPAVLRRGRRADADDVQLPGEPAPLPRAGHGRRVVAGGGHEAHQAEARDGAVGRLPAQQRRARPGAADRAAARRGLRRVRPRQVDAALRSRDPAAAAAHAQR